MKAYKFDTLFSPIIINKTEIKNRIVYPALELLFSYDGKLNEKFINYFAERAKGGAGIVTVGPVGADDRGSFLGPVRAPERSRRGGEEVERAAVLGDRAPDSSLGCGERPGAGRGAVAPPDRVFPHEERQAACRHTRVNVVGRAAGQLNRAGGR